MASCEKCKAFGRLEKEVLVLSRQRQIQEQIYLTETTKLRKALENATNRIRSLEEQLSEARERREVDMLSACSLEGSSRQTVSDWSENEIDDHKREPIQTNFSREAISTSRESSLWPDSWKEETEIYPVPTGVVSSTCPTIQHLLNTWTIDEYKRDFATKWISAVQSGDIWNDFCPMRPGIHLHELREEVKDGFVKLVLPLLRWNLPSDVTILAESRSYHVSVRDRTKSDTDSASEKLKMAFAPLTSLFEKHFRANENAPSPDCSPKSTATADECGGSKHKRSQSVDYISLITLQSQLKQREANELETLVLYDLRILVHKHEKDL